MKADELTVQVPFMRVRRGLEVGFQQPGVEGGPIGPPTPLALCLARAHSLDQTLDDCGPGAMRILAGRLGISPQRLAQVHALVYLAPGIQEAVLLSKVEASRVNFRALLRIARMPLWQDQRAAWCKIAGQCPPPSESNPGGKAARGNTQS
jgi:hypothetical protein